MQYPLTLYGQKMKRSVHNADLKSCKGDLVMLTSTICFPDRKNKKLTFQIEGLFLQIELRS